MSFDQSYHIDASPQKVFRSLTAPKELAKWWVSKAEIEPKKGGSYSFDWSNGYHQDGEVLKCERDAAISYTWAGGSVAAIEIRKEGQGTKRILHHTGFKDFRPLAVASSLWGYYLTNLKSVLGHGNDLRSNLDGRD